MKYPIVTRNEEAKQWEIYLTNVDCYVQEEEHKISVMYNDADEVVGFKIKDNYDW